jgi:hypothetical protein
MMKIQKIKLWGVEPIIRIFVKIMGYQSFVHIQEMIVFANVLRGLGSDNMKN